MKNTLEVSFYDLYATGKLTEKDIKRLIRKDRKREIKIRSVHITCQFLEMIFQRGFMGGEMPAARKEPTANLAVLVKSGRKIAKMALMAQLELDRRYEVIKKKKVQ
jgi:hypothetical protein